MVTVGLHVPLWGHWAVVTKKLGWEGSSLQSKLEAPDVRVEVV